MAQKAEKRPSGVIFCRGCTVLSRRKVIRTIANSQQWALDGTHCGDGWTPIRPNNPRRKIPSDAVHSFHRFKAGKTLVQPI
jgi:hypothetical protein